jgi:putative ABC transport system substrate-binding protein
MGLLAAAAWPRPVHAEQSERVRRIGVLLNLAADDPESRARLAAFLQVLKGAGWSEGRNLRLDYRWGLGDLDQHRKNAAELIALGVDVLLVHGSGIMRQLTRVSRKVPVVFVSVADPVAMGFVASLARPGGNATGFTSIEYAIGGKWLELLKQMAPRVTRVAVIRDVEAVSVAGQIGALQAVANVLGVELSLIDLRESAEFEGAIAAFARQPNGGMVVTTTALAQIHRAQIIGLAAKHRLPTIYPYRVFAQAGGLFTYGPDTIDQYRQAATYVDRILRGAKPADLPVRQPTKFEMVINLKTAKALALEVPTSVLASADEVIE